MTWFAKSFEKNYPNEQLDSPLARPRCISAFSLPWKAIMSPLGVNLQRWIATHPRFSKMVVIGWTAKRFAREFNAEWATYKDPVVYWYDHSSFDASQSVHLRRVLSESIIIPMLRACYPLFNLPSAFLQPIIDYLTNYKVFCALKSSPAKRFKNPSSRIPIYSGTLTGTVSSGCFLTSSSNSLTNVTASLYSAGGIRISPFAGGDDFVAITERNSLPQISAKLAVSYSHHKLHASGLGLIHDGIKVHDDRFDFLSYDCQLTKLGLEVSKQVQRVVRYGSACQSHVDPVAVAQESSYAA